MSTQHMYELLVFQLFPGRESSSDYEAWLDTRQGGMVGGELLAVITRLNRSEIMQWIKCVAQCSAWCPPPLNQINIGKFSPHTFTLHTCIAASY